MIAVFKATVKEIYRTGFFISTFAAGLVLLVFVHFLSSFAIYPATRRLIFADIGYFTISFLSCLMAIYVSCVLVRGDFRSGVLHYILPKKISRRSFWWARYTGVNAALFVFTVVLTVIFCITGQRMGMVFGISVILRSLELLIVTSIAFFLSSLLSQLPAFFLTMILYTLGHMRIPDQLIPRVFDSSFQIWSVRCIYIILPDLELFNSQSFIVTQQTSMGSYLLHAGGYALTYAGILMLISTAIFKRRDC